jgi:hypothetical protein
MDFQNKKIFQNTLLTSSKNLTTATESATVAGELEKTKQDNKGKIVQ